MTRFYLDSSVALHTLLPGGNPVATTWIDMAAREHELYSSSLLELEVVRTLRRDQLPPSHGRPLLDRVEMISIDDGVLRYAAFIEQHVCSLDAIHLATVMLAGAAMTVATHDETMRRTADDLGLPTVDPLA